MSEKIPRIYFNRCFSSTPLIIKNLLSNKDSKMFKIYISHVSRNNYLEEVADYFEEEPPVTGKDYVDYCINFCIKHEIDVFIPRYNVTTLAEYQKDFESLGVKVMFVGNSELYNILDNKLKTYEALKEIDHVAIPKAFKITNFEDFNRYYCQLSENGNSVCMKPISGIGGNGFMQISEEITEVDELYQPNKSLISKDRLTRILKNADSIEPFLLMEYLEGDEYSIDCLAKNGRLIVAVPRRKLDLYRQNLEHKDDLIDLARTLTKHFALSYLYNIQVKYQKGQAHLIEINTRMSAGIHKSCFTGVNFLYLAVKQLIGEEVIVPSNIRWNFQIRVTENYELIDL